MIDGLPSFLPILQKNLIRYLMNLLKLFANLLCSHKEVNALYFGQFLKFGNLSSGANQDVSLADGLVVDDCEYVLADEEDLRGGYIGEPKDNIS